MFPAGTRGNNEDDEDGNPSTIFVPLKGQSKVEMDISHEADKWAPIEDPETKERYLLKKQAINKA